MLKVAILGANGFIGSRTVEMLHLGGLAEVRPIVRTLTSLARLSRFDLDCRIADACDRTSLQAAFQGCDMIVHAVAGDRQTILGSLAPTYQAAQDAGVKRIVYLSTASVHGQNPMSGTDENSPLSDRQPIAYNNSKVEAERQLLALRQQGTVELVMLRPGIVFGPRSYWTMSFADDLLAGKAYLVNDGKGICNSIYIDNLVHAIDLAIKTPGADQQAFLVSDGEQITWFDFYAPIASALGFEAHQIPNATNTAISTNPSLKDRIEKVLASKISLAFLSLFPYQWRLAARAALEKLFKPAFVSPWTFPTIPPELPPQPIATTEMALLQQCQYKLPDRKAREILGYQPIISFEEACQRSIGWLAFAGYPIIKSGIIKIQ
jgi:nucleoside-diphosphate-sugar epimerase